MSRTICITSALLLSVATSAAAQNSISAPSASAPASQAAPQQKTPEQVALEQLLVKYERLQAEVDEIKQQLAKRDAELATVRSGVPAATQPSPSTSANAAVAAPAADASAVAALEAKVDDLSAKSADLTKIVQNNGGRSNENPTSIRFHGIDLTPGGFLAAETVNRQHGIGGDVNTQFTGIPFSGQTAATLSEFNGSGRQSRITLLAEGKLPNATLRGYYEADFLSAGTTSNDNQSNSFSLRQRQVWGQAALSNGFTITGGQMWSLATEYRSGLTNTSEAIPLTIDAQYNVGFTWERQYGFRVTKKIGDHFWVGGALEQAQTLNIGGHNLPTLVFQQAGNAGGLYNSTANFSYNYAPDLIAKAAYENRYGHFELFGIGRFFRDRVFPNAQLPVPSAVGAFNSKAQGGGIGANASVPLFAKKLEVGAHILIGDGVGRYGSSTLPDATAHADGSLELLTGGSALAKVEWHATPRLDVYAYYGGEYAKRAFYATGLFVTAPGPTQGQPILAGYGAPNQNVSGCHTEVLPVSSPNGGGSVPGTAANCVADNRNIQEGTFGYWFRFYQGSRGTLQQGLQYSYAERHTWLGIGDPVTGLGGSPKAIDNMIFTSFRYYLPK